MGADLSTAGQRGGRGRGGPYSCHDDIWAIRPLIVSPWIKLKLGDQPSKATVNIAADTRPVPRFIIGRRNRPSPVVPRENFLNRGHAVLSKLSFDFLSSLLHVIFRIYDGLWFGGKWFKLLLVLSIQSINWIRNIFRTFWKKSNPILCILRTLYLNFVSSSFDEFYYNS